MAARLDRLAVLPLADAAAGSLLADLPEAERDASWRLVRRDGSSVGYLVIRGRIPDAVYRHVSARRELLGRLVPDGPAPRRYP